jgi:mono/diheme cytochrome c family protein
VSKSLFISMAMIVAASVGALAQSTPVRSPLWEGVYTDEQAARGSAAFGASCANCHTLESQGNRPLSGQKFWDSYTLKTVGELFTFVQKNMPNGRGGTLSDNTYADLVALVLKSNGIPAGSKELVPAAVAAIPIVPRDGASELPTGTLVRMVGCLTKTGADFVVTRGTPPQRTTPGGGIAADDATRALGEKSITLKYMMTKPDADVGKRVMATGLLIGIGGVDGLNVTTLTKVADNCP